MSGLFFPPVPTPEQTARVIAESKRYRRQGGSFNAMGYRTLNGRDYDEWLDAQPWPDAADG